MPHSLETRVLLEAAEAGVAIGQLRAGAEVLPDKALAKRGLAGDS